MKLRQFNKSQTHLATRYLIRVMAELANIEQAHHLIDDLSLVLAVLHRCHKAAPEIDNLPSSAAEGARRRG